MTNTPATPPCVGCIGAGHLGSAIMSRLVTAGFPVVVWNRTREKLAPVVALGARIADTPAALAEQSEIVLTCLTDSRALEPVLFGEHGVAQGASAGKLLVDMSTADAGHTREMAARLARICGMGWVDAPISGGPPAALEGRMAVMVGGTETDFERARPLWDALAGPCTLMGPLGAGQTTKMINQVLVSCTFTMLAEACALAERAGVDASRLSHALEGGRADSRLLQEFMPKMAQSNFTPEGKISNMVKDLEMIHSLAASVGATMPITAMVGEIHRKLVADGLGDCDNAELVRYFRSPTH